MERTKLRRIRLLVGCLFLLFVAAGGLWVWNAKRQYALNRRLITALVRHDSKQALTLLTQGADPNTYYNPLPTLTFKWLRNRLLRGSPGSDASNPTAFLIACGAEYAPENPHKWEGNYPEDVPLIREMLAHGADCTVKDRYNQSALHNAVGNYYRRVAQLLMQYGADVNAQDRWGSTPLMLSVSLGDTEMTRLLLERGANVAVEDKWGRVALHSAIYIGIDTESLYLLLAHGADPNQPDRAGETPLKFAQQQHLPDIEALLRKSRK